MIEKIEERNEAVVAANDFVSVNLQVVLKKIAKFLKRLLGFCPTSIDFVHQLVAVGPRNFLWRSLCTSAVRNEQAFKGERLVELKIRAVQHFGGLFYYLFDIGPCFFHRCEH